MNFSSQIRNRIEADSKDLHNFFLKFRTVDDGSDRDGDPLKMNLLFSRKQRISKRFKIEFEEEVST